LRDWRAAVILLLTVSGARAMCRALFTISLQSRGRSKVSLRSVPSRIDERRRHPSDLTADDRDLYSGLIRLHLLHHAQKGPIFGLGMIEELSRHGYRVSAGTLYPILHALEAKGYLKATEHRNGRHARRIYRATPVGRRALVAAKAKVQELFGELFEDE
jgi:PadR family transcriptional regulator, regulatory protein PadR